MHTPAPSDLSAIAAKETTLADASKAAPIARFFHDFIDFLPYYAHESPDATRTRAPSSASRESPRGGHRLSLVAAVNAPNVKLGSLGLASRLPSGGLGRARELKLRLEPSQYSGRGVCFSIGATEDHAAALGASIPHAWCLCAIFGPISGASWDERVFPPVPSRFRSDRAAGPAALPALIQRGRELLKANGWMPR